MACTVTRRGCGVFNAVPLLSTFISGDGGVGQYWLVRQGPGGFGFLAHMSPASSCHLGVFVLPLRRRVPSEPKHTCTQKNVYRYIFTYIQGVSSIRRSISTKNVYKLIFLGGSFSLKVPAVWRVVKKMSISRMRSIKNRFCL